MSAGSVWMATSSVPLIESKSFICWRNERGPVYLTYLHRSAQCTTQEVRCKHAYRPAAEDLGVF